jgi:hypothetical protein
MLFDNTLSFALFNYNKVHTYLGFHGYITYNTVIDLWIQLWDPLPNVVVEWLTLLLCIWEALGSNLSLEIGYPD